MDISFNQPPVRFAAQSPSRPGVSPKFGALPDKLDISYKPASKTLALCHWYLKDLEEKVVETPLTGERKTSATSTDFLVDFVRAAQQYLEGLGQKVEPSETEQQVILNAWGRTLTSIAEKCTEKYGLDDAISRMERLLNRMKGHEDIAFSSQLVRPVIETLNTLSEQKTEQLLAGISGKSGQESSSEAQPPGDE